MSKRFLHFRPERSERAIRTFGWPVYTQNTERKKLGGHVRVTQAVKATKTTLQGVDRFHDVGDREHPMAPPHEETVTVSMRRSPKPCLGREAKMRTATPCFQKHAFQQKYTRTPMIQSFVRAFPILTSETYCVWSNPTYSTVPEKQCVDDSHSQNAGEIYWLDSSH